MQVSSENVNTIAEEKRRLRSRIRQSRRSISTHERAIRDSAIQRNVIEFLASIRPQAVCAYSPMPYEPGGSDLAQRIRNALPESVPLYLPRVVPKAERAMEWIEFNGQLTPSAWGIPEPSGEPVQHIFHEEPLMILPALAIDYNGCRLGQGGGFYDSFFALKPKGIISCAVVDDNEIIDHVPTEDHDLTVDYIISGAAVVQKKGK